MNGIVRYAVAAVALVLLAGATGTSADPAAVTPAGRGVFFAPDDVRDFVLSIAAPTATAKTSDQTHEKVVTLGRIASGELRVTSMRLVADGQAPTFPTGTIAVLIARHPGMCQPPYSRDDLDGIPRGISSFFVDYRGQTIWEVGVRNSLAVFRQVNSATDFGPEETLNADPAKYKTYPCAKYD
jgi:hypothetical protein